MTTTSDRQVVAALAQAITQRIGKPCYDLWFVGKTKLAVDSGGVVVHVPNLFLQDWLEKKHGDAVRSAACAVIGTTVPVRFTIDAQLFQAARQAEKVSTPERAIPTEAAAPKKNHPELVKRPRRFRRLTDFVVGPCNRLAHAAAVSVVEAPAANANPLVLHGTVGTGKTHLLEGICAGLQLQHPGWVVRCVSSEDFTYRFIQAVRLGKLPVFRKYFRECHALLIDDLHFLARKRVTQEEFLHTFDALLADGKQIVMTCDCHPRLAEEFTPELTDRLLGGPVWGLTPPDAETRLDILRAKSVRGEPGIPDDVLQLLAGELRGNVRELEGAIHSVRHYGVVAGRPIDIALAREALGDLLRHSIRTVGLADVERAIGETLGLDRQTLLGKKRGWAASHPRMLAMYLARKHTGATYGEIGQHFGGRNHSTVVAAEKKVRRSVDDDGEMVFGERKVRVRELIGKIERCLSR